MGYQVATDSKPPADRMNALGLPAGAALACTGNSPRQPVSTRNLIEQLSGHDYALLIVSKVMQWKPPPNNLLCLS